MFDQISGNYSRFEGLLFGAVNILQLPFFLVPLLQELVNNSSFMSAECIQCLFVEAKWELICSNDENFLSEK